MRRKTLWILLLVFALALVGAHQYTLARVRVAVIDTLRSENQYPATVSSFSGLLPLGKVWVSELKFRTRFGDQTVDWAIANGSLDLGVPSALGRVWRLDSLQSKGIGWKVSFPKGVGSLEGLLDLSGRTSVDPAGKLPKETLWCGDLRVGIPIARAVLPKVTLELLHQGELRVAPFSLADGEPFLPYDFNLRANLAEKTRGGLLLAKGHHVPLEKKLAGEARALGLGVPTIESFLKAASGPMGTAALRASDWIEGGSFSVLLQVDSTALAAKGNLTLRLQKIRFGREIKESELVGEAARPVLDAIEKREDVVQLGPVSFEEDLSTEDMESLRQLQRGLVAEVVKVDPGAAYKAGANLLRGLLKKD
ncbi:MAG: hypothetical protein HUU16_15845 [Candidatus Omnitrophica bacterium]|nr:hypothetical protein [Candidatus Omnitrophota bacterium]